MMGSVDEDTLSLLRDQFKALDADGSGSLDAADVRTLQRASVGLGSDCGSFRGSSSSSGAGARAAAASDALAGAAEVCSSSTAIDPSTPQSMSRRAGAAATGGAAPAALTDRTLTYLDQTRLDSSELSKYLDQHSPAAAYDNNRTGQPSQTEGRGGLQGGVERTGSPLMSVLSEGLPFFGGGSRGSAADGDKGSSYRSAASAASSARVERMLERVLVNQERLLAKVEAQREEAGELEALVRRRSDVQELAVGQLGREVAGLRSWTLGNAMAKLKA